MGLRYGEAGCTYRGRIYLNRDTFSFPKCYYFPLYVASATYLLLHLLLVRDDLGVVASAFRFGAELVELVARCAEA